MATRSIPDEIVHQIRQTANIVQLASHLGYNATKRGSSYFIVCPFHADSSDDGGSCVLNVPSYSERRSRGDGNWFKCFGSCGLTGSVFTFYCLHHGWPTDGFWFQRAVQEVADIFGMGHIVPEVSSTNDRRIRMRQLFESVGLDFCGPTFIQSPERDDPGYCDTWTLKSRASDRLPAGLLQAPGAADERDLFESAPKNEPLVFWPLIDRREPVRYPVRVVLVEALSVAAVIERHGLRTRGVLLYEEDLASAAQWQMSRNRAEFVDAVPDEPDTLPLIGARLAVESPLDWIRLSRAGYPVSWGLWQPGITPSRGPIRSVPPAVIPQMVTIHPGSGHTGPARMRKCVDPDQCWIPRSRELPHISSLAVLAPGRLRRALERWEHEVNGPDRQPLAAEAAPT